MVRWCVLCGMLICRMLVQARVRVFHGLRLIAVVRTLSCVVIIHEMLRPPDMRQLDETYAGRNTVMPLDCSTTSWQYVLGA